MGGGGGGVRHYVLDSIHFMFLHVDGLWLVHWHISIGDLALGRHVATLLNGSYGSTPAGALLFGSGHSPIVRRAVTTCHHAHGWQPGSPPAGALVCCHC